jgi:hypothetical protein
VSLSSAPTPQSAPPPAPVAIDRLRLVVSGLDVGAAKVFARLVAEGLAAGLGRSPGTAGLDSLHLDMAVNSAEAGEPAAVARRVVDEVGRALARDRVASGPDGELSA